MTLDKPLEELRRALGDRALVRELLAPRTTLRVGGPADLLIEVKTVAELVYTVRQARQFDVPVFILGNGSNILVLDKGIRGLVIENHCSGYELQELSPGRAVVRAESGASLPGLANRLARQGWSGLEWGIGIPGTVGAAIVGNAGAHGGCMADRVTAIETLDERGQIVRSSNQEIGFEYRSSRFRHFKREVILRAEIELARDDPAACMARMNEYTERRRQTQPTEASVGSMFKNPPGDYAGRLIEQAGLKGTRVGNALVSPVHANFFVNQGGATAKDVVRLVELVRDRVKDQFGIELQLEIEICGEGIS